MIASSSYSGCELRILRKSIQLGGTLKLEVPNSVILADGTTAEVKGATAMVIDGQLSRIVYTVEKQSGAWMDVASEEVYLRSPQSTECT